MKEEILHNLTNPGQLERMFRANKTEFERSFQEIYPLVKDDPAALFWHERLRPDEVEPSKTSGTELIFVAVAALVAGLIAKVPDFFQIDQEYYYTRNIPFIVFPALIGYFSWKRKLRPGYLLLLTGLVVISAVFINFLPDNNKSDTLLLACIHLPLFFWTLLGFSYVGGDLKNFPERLGFLRFNGDLIVMTTILTIAGWLLTIVTIGLFKLIEMEIGELYFRFAGIWGLAALPLVATYLVQTNPQLVARISPVIARIFTPLVLVMLIVYLIAVFYTGKDPYNDREFLLVFNMLLIGVMALIVFSIAETSRTGIKKSTLMPLFALSTLTIVLNGIALSAIVFRISELGFTPNRLAVLGSNLLILAHLVFVAYALFITFRTQSATGLIERNIAWFLPIYSIWTVLVTFVFPFVFGFR